MKVDRLQKHTEGGGGPFFGGADCVLLEKSSLPMTCMWYITPNNSTIHVTPPDFRVSYRYQMSWFQFIFYVIFLG